MSRAQDDYMDDLSLDEELLEPEPSGRSDRPPAPDDSDSPPSLTQSEKRLARVFVGLLLVDTLAVTALAMVRPKEFGWWPMFFPVVLALIGIVAFKWAPRLRKSEEDMDAMPGLLRSFYQISLGFIGLAQVAAIVLALFSLLLFVISFGGGAKELP